MELRDFGDMTVRDCSKIMLAGRKGMSVSQKGANDLVTSIDLECERYFRSAVHGKFSDHVVWGEEDGLSQSSDVPFSQVPDSDNVWVIDPIDGTVNFANDIPFFSMSLACFRGGVLELAWVHDPVHDELFFAEYGKGAYMNNSRISCEGSSPRTQAVFASTGVMNRLGQKNRSTENSKMLAQLGKIRILGSQALHLCYVAAGRGRGALSVEAKVWDDIAGALILQESGGRYGYVGSLGDVISEDRIGIRNAMTMGSQSRASVGAGQRDYETWEDVVRSL